MKTAHTHLISAMWAESPPLHRFSSARPLRVLDIGCGYGGLIADLIHWQKQYLPNLPMEIFGYEVVDHRGQTPGYLETVLGNLNSVDGDVNWAGRIRVGEGNSPWPFTDKFFDIVISNQVIEHVQHLNHFLSETNRVAKSAGKGIHFFPAQEIWIEPHSGVPFAHFFQTKENRFKWIDQCSRLGLGKFPGYHRERGSGSDVFANEFVNYLERYVFFRKAREIATLATKFSTNSGFGYERPLLKRSISDDWDLFSYKPEGFLSATSLLSSFAPCTLVQRF